MHIDDLQHEIYEWAKSKGWWDEERDVGMLIALMHSELSEALEEFRKGHDPAVQYEHEADKPEGVGIELADCIIRILGFAEHFNIDMTYCLQKKMDYNYTRPYRHGGKRA